VLGKWLNLSQFPGGDHADARRAPLKIDGSIHCSDRPNLIDGTMWSTTFALKELSTPSERRMIRKPQKSATSTDKA
jgi:hypothetical protein